MADNSYGIEIKVAAKSGWDTPAQAKARYGRYSREGLTVHWWNTPDKIAKNSGSHDNIVNYILSKAVKGIGSVNYVLSDYKITMLVNPDNVAWASQSGNPTTVSVEFDPHLSNEGYKKAGWLIDQLEQRFGHRLNLHPHSKWYSTACPGTLDMNRMRVEADKWKSGFYDTPPPAAQPKITYRRIEKRIWLTTKQPTNLWNLNFNKYPEAVSIKTFDKDAPLEIVGIADHPIGAQYLMTAHSFGRADETGAPDHAAGFNRNDMAQAPEPTPTPVPDPTPVPEPTPTPPVVTPPSDSEHEAKQDNDIAFIKGTLNSLLALLREFAQSILTKFGKE